MLAKIDLWILLFLAAAAQGLFLVFVMLIKNKQGEKSQYALTALIAAFTLTLGSYLLFWTGLGQALPILLGIATQLTFLFGPLLLFYFNLIEKPESKIDYRHFIPFGAIALLLLLNIYFFQSTYINIAVSILQCLHLILYAVLIYSLTNYQKSNSDLQNIVKSFLAYCLCFCTYYILVWIGAMKIEYDYMVSLAMAFFIYYLGYRGFVLSTNEKKSPNEEKYAQSSLSPSALASIEKTLDSKMAVEKYYLNGDLKIQDLSSAIEVNLHSLSQTINVVKQKSFNDYINELRVKEALRLLNESSHENEKLLAIALDAGFNNKTSFLNAFKKHTGKTPSAYRKSLNPKSKVS